MVFTVPIAQMAKKQCLRGLTFALELSIVFISLFNSLESKTLANTAQAKKRARQAEKNRQHNASIRSRFRTYVKNVLKAITAGDKTQAEAAYKEAVSVIDRTARKGIIHANKAARHKSRLHQRIRNMQAQA